MAKAGKGSQFERDMARALSRWWTNGKRDDVFWRSAMSGGMATTRRKQGRKIQTHIGDLVAVDPVGAPLIESTVIELKRGYKAWCALDLLDSPKPQNCTLRKFLDQVADECRAANLKMFLLICRRDGRKAIVLSPLPFGQPTLLVNGIHVSRLEALLQTPAEKYLAEAQKTNRTGHPW